MTSTLGQDINHESEIANFSIAKFNCSKQGSTEEIIHSRYKWPQRNSSLNGLNQSF